MREICRLNVNKIEIVQTLEKSMVIAVHGVQLHDRERAKDLMLMLGLDEVIDQWVMVKRVYRYIEVLKC